MQPTAKIIETNYAKVDLEEVLNTNNFDFEKITTSAGWIKELEKDDEKNSVHNEHEENENYEHESEEQDEHERVEHHHEHHHHHDEGEAEEYGISTFVYTSRKPFSMAKFRQYINESFPKNVIRCKGLVWFKSDNDMSYIFEQAGKQLQLSEGGYWLATAPKEELAEIIANEPDALKDWDEEVGDRMVKLVFIGRKMDKENIVKDLDSLIQY